MNELVKLTEDVYAEKVALNKYYYTWVILKHDPSTNNGIGGLVPTKVFLRGPDRDEKNND